MNMFLLVLSKDNMPVSVQTISIWSRGEWCSQDWIWLVMFILYCAVYIIAAAAGGQCPGGVLQLHGTEQVLRRWTDRCFKPGRWRLGLPGTCGRDDVVFWKQHHLHTNSTTQLCVNCCVALQCHTRTGMHGDDNAHVLRRNPWHVPCGSMEHHSICRGVQGELWGGYPALPHRDPLWWKEHWEPLQYHIQVSVNQVTLWWLNCKSKFTACLHHPVIQQWTVGPMAWWGGAVQRIGHAGGAHPSKWSAPPGPPGLTLWRPRRTHTCPRKREQNNQELGRWIWQQRAAITFFVLFFRYMITNDWKKIMKKSDKSIFHKRPLFKSSVNNHAMLYKKQKRICILGEVHGLNPTHVQSVEPWHSQPDFSWSMAVVERGGDTERMVKSVLQISISAT